MKAWSAGFAILIFILVITVSGRKLRYGVNPGCRLKDGTDCESWTNKTLLHIMSDSDLDTLHFVWSFQGSPSLLLARTELGTNLTVNWDRLFDGSPGSLAFDGTPPFYTFSYSLHKFWTYEDPNDLVRIDRVNQSNVMGYETKDLLWQRQDNNSILNSSFVQVTFLSGQYKDRYLGPDGFFSLTVKVRDSDGYSDILPYMLHNSNMTQIDIWLSNLQMNYPDSNSPHLRFALNFLLSQDEPKELNSSTASSNMHLETVKSLDDEHTPGVFNTVRLRTPVLGSFDQSFLLWKPVSYFGKVRDITNSIDVASYDIKDVNGTVEDSSMSNSVLWAYYGDRLDSMQLQETNISFGSEKDGWYNKTPHISWTYMTGFGNPPDEYVSFLVILVMAVGLGVPSVIICASVIYFVVKKLAKPKDDLLLGH